MKNHLLTALLILTQLGMTGCATTNESVFAGFAPFRAIAGIFQGDRAKHPSKMKEFTHEETAGLQKDAVVFDADETSAGETLGGRSSLNRYAMRRADTAVSASISTDRVSSAADYRVLYFPGEQTDSYSSEGGRELVRVAPSVAMRNPFDAAGRGAGNMAADESPDGMEREALSYVAPDKTPLRAAARMGQVSTASDNVIANPAVSMRVEYRRAKARIGNPPREVAGIARPLGIFTYDKASLRAAADAIDSRAGEVLVYFPEFGFGGFVAEETPNYTRQVVVDQTP